MFKWDIVKRTKIIQYVKLILTMKVYMLDMFFLKNIVPNKICFETWKVYDATFTIGCLTNLSRRKLSKIFKTCFLVIFNRHETNLKPIRVLFNQVSAFLHFQLENFFMEVIFRFFFSILQVFVIWKVFLFCCSITKVNAAALNGWKFVWKWLNNGDGTNFKLQSDCS